jgi:hypothetical protein
MSDNSLGKLMECAMHTNMNLRVDPARRSNSTLPVSVWIGGVTARALFIVILVVITTRVASPQVENLRSILETPSDLVRVGLGFTVCMWLIANVFILPKDTDAYRTWLYLGPALGPSPIAHSRQTGVVQLTGQPPPSAKNSAAVSARRLASVCTRITDAIR